jgi:hypothetical protein
MRYPEEGNERTWKRAKAEGPREPREWKGLSEEQSGVIERRKDCKAKR